MRIGTRSAEGVVFAWHDPWLNPARGVVCARGVGIFDGRRPRGGGYAA
jgi:hypothetical protein